MSKRLAGRHVRMFRCHQAPLIGPKVMNAHNVAHCGWKCEVNEEATGVIVTTQDGQEHFVGFTNIESMELLPLPPEASISEIKPKLGRPFKNQEQA